MQMHGRSDTATKANHKLERKRLVMRDISLEDKPANWRRVKEAGVAFWVNNFTGVATEECPYDSLQPLAACEAGKCNAPKGVAADGSEEPFEVGQEEGTGALVYDRSEFEQAMRILDIGMSLSLTDAP